MVAVDSRGSLAACTAWIPAREARRDAGLGEVGALFESPLRLRRRASNIELLEDDGGWSEDCAEVVRRTSRSRPTAAQAGVRSDELVPLPVLPLLLFELVCLELELELALPPPSKVILLLIELPSCTVLSGLFRHCTDPRLVLGLRLRVVLGLRLRLSFGLWV